MAHKKILKLIDILSLGVYDKEREIKLALLTAMANENILMLGPPGVAKSMVARVIKNVFKNASSFEYLMSRFSTPDEIFGPISIKGLKETDKYERCTEGYLPTADVVFLDEIWKAGPAIQNTLLTAINEHIFRNGDREVQLPMKLLIAASNELPAQGEGLEALWDRFVVRIICGGIRNEETFYDMLRDKSDTGYAFDNKELKALQITDKEYKEFQKEALEVTLTNDVLHCITKIREGIREFYPDKSNTKHSIYVSDRRWKKIAKLLRTSALLNGRKETNPSDLYAMYNCIWNSPDEIDLVRNITMNALFTPCLDKLAEIRKKLEEDTKKKEFRKAQIELGKDNEEKILKVYNDYFYHVKGHGTGHTYIYAADFRRLRELGTVTATFFKDKYNDLNTNISLLDVTVRESVRDLSDELTAEEKLKEMDRVQRIKISRGDKPYYLIIDGVRWELTIKSKEELEKEKQEKAVEIPDFKPQLDYESEIENVGQMCDDIMSQLKSNIFADKEDTQKMEEFCTKTKKEIAFVRIDIGKLLYDE